MRASWSDEQTRACLPALNRYAHALTGDPPTAEDLLRATLIRLASAPRRARRQANPAGYGRAVMFRRYLSPWRAMWDQVAGRSRGLASPAAVPELTTDTQGVLRRALNELPRAQRAVLILTYLDALDDSTIARLLRRRPTKIRSLRHRAQQALRERLAGSARLTETNPIWGTRAVTLAPGSLADAPSQRGGHGWYIWHDRGGRRRRITAVVAAPLAVLLAAGGTGLAVLWLGGHGRRPTATAPGAPPAGAQRTYPRILGLGFAGPDRGYLLTGACQERRTARRHGQGTPRTDGVTCRQRLSASVDGGRTWRDRTLPREDLLNHDVSNDDRAGRTPSARNRLPLLSVIGPDTLALYSGSRDRRWLSLDGGRTWHANAPWPVNTVTRIPANGWLAVNGPLPERRWLEVLTPDGTASVLDGGPKGADPGPQITNDGVTRATDGSYWLKCANADPCAVVTRDRGRSWRTVRPKPLPPGPVGTNWISTRDGRTVYVGVGGADPDGTRRVTRLFHSADGGLTWDVVSLPGPWPGAAPHGGASGGAPGVALGGAEVLPGGDLLVAVDGALYRKPANGTAFSIVADGPQPVGMLTRSGPWLVAITDPMTDLATVHLSRDGVSWAPVRLP